MGRESAQRYRRRLDEVMAPETRWTPCLCPGCGRRHQLKKNYTGGGTARFRCPSCTGINSRIFMWGLQ
jgi:transposase-like protein